MDNQNLVCEQVRAVVKTVSTNLPTPQIGQGSLYLMVTCIVVLQELIILSLPRLTSRDTNLNVAKKKSTVLGKGVPLPSRPAHASSLLLASTPVSTG